jgi:hypothetical protein
MLIGEKAGETMTADEWWELLRTAPRVAGPWTRKETEHQRVDTILVRRRPNGKECVMVYGPVKNPVNNSDAWAVIFPDLYISTLPLQKSLPEAVQAADEALREHNILLCQESEM